MKKNIVVILLVLFILAFCVLVNKYWVFGLDLASPVSVKEWIISCSRGREDIYCKYILGNLNNIHEPVIVLRPNDGDRIITEELNYIINKDPRIKINDIAKSNILLIKSYDGGSILSSDGVRRKLECEDGKLIKCKFDHIGISINQKFGDGYMFFSYDLRRINNESSDDGNYIDFLTPK